MMGFYVGSGHGPLNPVTRYQTKYSVPRHYGVFVSPVTSYVAECFQILPWALVSMIGFCDFPQSVQ
jgi:hypothetical protein